VVAFKIFERCFIIGFKFLVSSATNYSTSGTISAIAGAAICDEKKNSVRISVNETRHGHVTIFSTGISHFFRACCYFFYVRNDLSSNRAVRIVWAN
jgi:hypothetical protein